MRHAAAGLAALLALGSCGDGPPLPDEDLVLRVTLGAEEVVPGRAFPVTVVRAWRKDLDPTPWEERALAPLVLRLEDLRRREDERTVEETRRYRAYVFARSDVLVPGVKATARPRDGGPERSVLAPRRRLRVLPEVDALRPGPPELPGEPLAEPFPWIPWATGLAAAALLAAAWAWRRARRKRTGAPTAVLAPAAPSPGEHALARLRALAERGEGGDAGARAVEAAEILRGFVGARFGIPAPVRTSEEVLAAVPGDAGIRALPCGALAGVLRLADDVKFAAHRATAAETDAALQDAVRFVASGRPGERP